MTESPVAVRGRHALTPIQRALYASQQRDPRAPTQNMVRLSHIDGQVDPQRLADSFAAVVAASDVLRTQIRTEGNRETVVRLSDEPAATEIIEMPRADALQWAEERAGELLPLARRAHDSVVLVHEDGTASWYLALHHCVTDATSSSLVFRRTADVYEGHSIELGGYYEWAERIAAAGPAHDRARRHWDERPAAPRVGHLYERHLPATPSSTRLAIEIDDDLESSIVDRLASDFRSFSTDLSWTTTLLTATAVYLHRVSGATSFALGLPVHNRSSPGALELLGPLVEVFPVDVVVELDDTFLTLHRRVSRSLNQTLRFAQPGTAPSGTDVEAVVNVIPEGDLDRFGPYPTTTTRVHPGASDANHLLRLQLTRYGNLELTLDVNDAAVGAPRHARATTHFETVLRHMVTAPAAPIGGFSLLGDDESRVLATWGEGPPAPAPAPTATIDGLRDALATAQHVALVDGDSGWTGDELWARVQELAAHLQHLGVGPGARVAVLMERSADAVVAMLATMAAGGSYVPIDPAQPRARSERLIERAGCAVTLEDVPPFRGDGTEPGPVERSPDHEAYLLFTSGSTGEPKGVPISHRGLASYLAFARNSYLADGERPVVPLFSALTFDLTVTSLFLPLLTGGRLVVIKGDGPAATRAVAETTDITWCKATPSHLELLVRLLPDDHALATLVVGGEAFGVPLARRLRTVLPHLRIFNEYGPTEAVVGCMIHEQLPDEFPGCPDVPIGRPAPGVSLRVLDAHLQPVPPGAPGELHISHSGLTGGYLDGDTSRFVEIDGERWYRSGDLVRLLDDHTLVYLRRVDEQLKVGGIRLDPSEIEAALVEHPSVRRAAVRSWSPRHLAPDAYCVRCGLADNVPGVVFDDAGVCDRCHAYDEVKDQAAAWFKEPADLTELRDRARRERTGAVDCVALLSGGKDSTYALYQLVRMGFEVHALTLDNGFISDEAKANIRRSVANLGIDHEFATTDDMAAIFRDSLERHSNVCHGCFKTIYTFATNRAVELGAPLIVTGLSRGQLFETRLIPAQFSERRFDPDAIDAAVVAARKAYHRADDAVTRLLDNKVFEQDDLFERITYVDFYRYVDVELTEMLRFLEEEAPWVRPADTGRSTNCRINAAGIQTHLIEQGYHNYAEPYAWDVRLGHKRRDEALAELDDRDDADEVAAMLADVEYRPHRRETLTGWIEVRPGAEPPTPAELRAHLQRLLPAHAIPTAFVVTDELPMTANGKLDTDALPAPERSHRSSPALVLEPTSPVERTIVGLWERQLGIEPVSADDDYFGLGGDSLGALEMTMLLSEELGVDIPDEVVFANATPRALADAVAPFLSDRPAALRSAPHAGMGGDPPRLSAGEQAMLFEHRLRPEDPRYNVGRLYRVDGVVDPVRLRAAVATVVSRHQPFHWSYASPRRELTVDEALWFDARSAATWQEVDDDVRQLHRRPFDLDAGPLVRCAVHDVGGESTGVTLVTHHVSIDATCFDRLWTEVEAAYHGDDLPPIDVGYADHAAWQAAAANEADLAYWRDAVGAVPRLALHRPDRPEPDGVRERTAEVRADELRAATGTAPFATVLAALATVMQRSTGSDEVTVGALVSTKDHPSANDLIGYYLNALPLTLDAEPDQSFAALRDACGEVFAGGLAHRTVPFAAMVADRRRSGAPDPTPQVLVAMEDLDDVSFGRHRVAQEVLLSGSSVADATFFVEPREGEVVLVLEYRGSVIGADAADRLLADLDAALVAALRRPDDTVGSCRFDSEAGSLLLGPSPQPTRHVVDRIHEQMAERADRTAVRCGSTSISWAELDHWSAAVAGRLLDAGVAPGDRVVVSMQRSVELVVAIVGILRAGAAYVPVDPTYPHSRNRVVAAASGAAAFLAGDGTPDLGIDAIAVDMAPAPRDGEPAARPTLPGTDLDAPAYVIFTSGSTGEPRGVVVTHRQLALSTAARADAYPSDPERFLLMSSAAFDSSVAGLFWTLTTGGSLVLPGEHEVHDLDAVLDLFATADITHTLVVPSLYRALLVRAEPEARWPGHVIIAGEACAPDVVALHFADRPGTALTNEYGPTEATVWSTYAHLDQETEGVPIGRPIAGTWVAVVDARDQLCPEGVTGELLIGGGTVTGGYAGLDSDRFSDESPHGPGRVFRTGDVVAAVDGRLYFHGRRDDQLNVGGVRIEPGEIEAAIATVPEVDAVVVVACDRRPIETRLESTPPARLADAMRTAAEHPDPLAALGEELAGTGRLDLVAHVETGGAAVEVDTLRARVHEALPPSSRPVGYGIHDRLPRSPNGKVDRAAAASLPVEGSAPRPAVVDDDALAALVTLYREVLARDDVGPDDDFFDAGGDSLLALELMLHIERLHGGRPRLSVLFEARTPRALLAVLGPDRSENRGAERAHVLQEGTAEAPPLWLLPGAGGVLLVYERLVALLDPGLRILGAEYPGTQGERLPCETVEELGAHFHRVLVTTQPHGPYRLLGYSLGGLVALDVAGRLRAEGREVDYVGAVASGLAEAADTRSRREKMADDWRETGITAVGHRLGAAARTRVRGIPSRVRNGARDRLERSAVRRLGLRPSDRFVFDRMIATSTEAGRRYRPSAVDAAVVLYLGDDGGERWVRSVTAAWEAVAAGGLRVVMVPGSHHAGTMLFDPNVATLAESVNAELAPGPIGDPGAAR